MTTTLNDVIAQGGQPQWEAVDPNSAASNISFVNQSADRLVVSWDGGVASPTHGFLLAAGANIFVSRAGAALGGLHFPWGAISVYGPTINQAFQVLVDQ